MGVSSGISCPHCPTLKCDATNPLVYTLGEMEVQRKWGSIQQCGMLTQLPTKLHIKYTPKSVSSGINCPHCPTLRCEAASPLIDTQGEMEV